MEVIRVLSNLFLDRTQNGLKLKLTPEPVHLKIKFTVSNSNNPLNVLKYIVTLNQAIAFVQKK